MKCHEFQAAIGAEPSSTEPQLLAHAEECAACARYRQELQAMDTLIHHALAIPIQPAARASTEREPTERTSFAGWRIAASLFTAIMIAGSIWVASTRESFAEQIATHTHHESFALVRTDERVEHRQLAAILARSNLRLKPGAADVSYASSCPFRGHVVPHLVVQSEHGPVTVLVLTNEEPVQAQQTIDEDGYEGVIVPAPRGVIAVLGKDVPVEEVAQKLSWAIEYR